MRLKKILAILLTAVLLVSSTVIALPVSADGDATLGGQGTEESPYLINSKDDLLTLATSVNDGTLTTSGKFFKQTADIDLADVAWTGIGKGSNPFKGTYDGDDHVITNLTLAGTQNVNGLFGVVNSATIQNVGIASGTSTVECNAGTQLGNLIGYAEGTLTVSNCFNAADLEVTLSSALTSHAGGLIGFTKANSTIENCWNTGNVTFNAPSATNVGVGGIAGTIGASNATTDFSVTDCHSVCNIKVDYAGAWDGIGVLFGKGVITKASADGGESWSVEDCSAGGTVTVTNAATSNEFTGLFVGYTERTHTWTNCTSSVTGTKNGATLNKLVANGDTSGITTVTNSTLIGNYAQNGEVDGNSVRFVSELAFSTAAFKKTGFEVTVTSGDNEGAKNLEGVVVYEKLSAGEGTVSPENGKYFIAYGISDIPADATATFVVTPFVVTLDGDYIYGETATFDMVDGDIVDPVA